jgi:thiol-disulfide isomerase/thioredoxin
MPSSPVSQRAFALITLCALGAAVLTYVVLANVTDDAVDATGPALTLAPPAARVGSLEEITLTRYDGTKTTLAEVLDDRPTVINFFGSWCVPCVTEMPAFESVSNDVGDEVAFIGLAVNDRAQDAQRIVDQTGVTYPTLLDADGLAMTFFGGIQMPTTAFVDAEGTALDRADGAMTGSELRDELAEQFGIAG